MEEYQNEITQIESPYYSTTAFEDFLSRHQCFRDGTEILDIGSGIGAALYYFQQKHPAVKYFGIDYNQKKIEFGKKLIAERKVEDIDLDSADWFNLPADYKGRFEGIVSIHAVCCLKHIEKALEPMFALQPRWIAINSLFYDGPLDVLTHIRNHNNPDLKDDNPDGDFNIFSLTRTSDISREKGYEVIYEPFYPAGAIQRRDDGGRGTYTMKTDFHEHTQFSGPVFLPWHFVLIRKKDS